MIPPFWQERGSVSYPLGTDQLGRDIWARLVYGARTSFIVALGALAVGGVLGTALGFNLHHYSGFHDSLYNITIPWYNKIILGLVAIFCAALIIVILGAIFGVSLIGLIIALGMVTWPPYAKAMRAISLEHHCRSKENQASGHPNHHLPSVAGTVKRLAALVPPQLGFLIIAESILTFLMAVPSPFSSWGNMVALGRGHIGSAWWVSVVPLVTIMLLAFGFYMLGDWLRDRLDLKLRQA